MLYVFSLYLSFFFLQVRKKKFEERRRKLNSSSTFRSRQETKSGIGNSSACCRIAQLFMRCITHRGFALPFAVGIIIVGSSLAYTFFRPSAEACTHVKTKYIGCQGALKGSNVPSPQAPRVPHRARWLIVLTP